MILNKLFGKAAVARVFIMIEGSEQPAPTPAAQTSQPPVHTIDRRSALVIACIGSISALLGALAGGCGTYKAAVVGAESSQREDADRFKREEREKAYHDYLNDIDDAASAAAAIGVAYISYGDKSYPFEFVDQVKELSAAKRKSDVSRHLVDLVGSPSIRDVASKLNTALLDANSIASGSLEAWYDKTRDRKTDIDKASSGFYDQYNPINGLIKNFIEAARQDLGVAN